MTQPTISMTLLVDTEAKRVLFAEASKECVDFLFSIFSIPIGTVTALLREQGMVGSLANLYTSIENLNDSYLQPSQSKNTVLNPVVPARPSKIPLLLPTNAAPSEKSFYKCVGVNCSGYVTDAYNASCPQCCRGMTTTLRYVPPPRKQKEVPDEGGFVKGLVTYMVTDDLVVKPASTISSITMLSKFKVKDVSVLEEREVKLGMSEALSLLKASLQSQRVLTDVFLKGCESAEVFVAVSEVPE